MGAGGFDFTIRLDILIFGFVSCKIDKEI